MLDSNRRSLVSEATALPTSQQPCANTNILLLNITIIKVRHYPTLPCQRLYWGQQRPLPNPDISSPTCTLLLLINLTLPNSGHCCLAQVKISRRTLTVWGKVHCTAGLYFSYLVWNLPKYVFIWMLVKHLNPNSKTRNQMYTHPLLLR